MKNNDIARKVISDTVDKIKEILLQKNQAYGNSAFDPIRMFSKADPEEQINVRLDDKLSRLARGENAGEDVTLDLIGYLILKRSYAEYTKAIDSESLKESDIIDPKHLGGF